MGSAHLRARRLPTVSICKHTSVCKIASQRSQSDQQPLLAGILARHVWKTVEGSKAKHGAITGSGVEAGLGGSVLSGSGDRV